MLPMFFSGGIWWIVTSGGAVKPTAPRWLREGPRSIQNCMSFGATPNSCSSTPRVQSAAVCWYSGTPTRRPFRSAGRSMPESLPTRISAWKNFLVVKIGRPIQRSSPFDLAIISEENDISETSKSAKRSWPEELGRMHGARYEGDAVRLHPAVEHRPGPGIGRHRDAKRNVHGHLRRESVPGNPIGALTRDRPLP